MREELLNFTHNFKTYMEYYGITQLALSEKLNVSTASVSQWANGVTFPRIGKIDEMCEIFHCTRSDLIERRQTPSTIGRKTLMNLVLSKLDTLNEEGLKKVITTIDDLNDKYKEK